MGQGEILVSVHYLPTHFPAGGDFLKKKVAVMIFYIYFYMIWKKLMRLMCCQSFICQHIVSIYSHVATFAFSWRLLRYSSLFGKLAFYVPQHVCC